MQQEPRGRRETGAFLLALAWIVLTIGVRPLAIPDEGRYVSASWEMLVSGNWLYPTLNGLPFFHKPPLFYWITAGSLSVFGTHAWAGRLASVAGAAIAALALYGFALRRSGRVDARTALLVLVTTPFFFGGAQFASLDMLVAGFIFATTALAGEAAIDAANGEPYRARLAAAYACAALGVLSKGLIGAVLPGLAILLWLAWCRRLSLLLRLLWWPGLVLFAVIALPWFVAMQLRFPYYLHYFFVYQQFQRFAEGGFNNPQPVWFYLPLLLVGFLPWSAWAWRAFRMRDDSPRGTLSPRALMWIAAAVTVVFFSIPQSKMIGYVLPAVPPLAFVLADAIGQPVSVIRGSGGALRWSALASAVLCIVLVVISGFAAPESTEALSRRIAGTRGADEPMYFYHSPVLDMPFYARLQSPAKVVQDWKSFRGPGSARDDWRMTLYEAGQFDPPRAHELLLDEEQFVTDLCAQPVAWVVAKARAGGAHPVLGAIAPTFRDHAYAAWRVTASDLAERGLCPQKPEVASLGKSMPIPSTG